MPTYDLCTVLHLPGALTRAAAQAVVTERSFSCGEVPDVQAYLLHQKRKDIMEKFSTRMLSCRCKCIGRA